MKNKQQGFGVVEGLLVIIAITLIVGVGFYVANSMNKKDDSTATPVSASSKQASTAAEDQKSDKELIIAAVKADDKADAGGMITDKSTITIDDIQGSNAKGEVFTPDDGTDAASGGYEFIAHKSGSDWKIVFKGQEKPGKDVGTQYDLPSDWYDASY